MTLLSFVAHIDYIYMYVGLDVQELRLDIHLTIMLTYAYINILSNQ